MIYRGLDDGATCLNDTPKCDEEGLPLACEDWADRNWGLIHQGGTLTYWHHDANGKVTMIIVERGVKMWLQLHIKRPLPRSQVDIIFEKIIQYKDADEEITWEDDAEAVTLLLLPGDVVCICVIIGFAK